MYYFRLYAFLVLFYTSSAFSQEAIPSFKEKLAHAQHDTERCRMLHEMIEAEADDKLWPVYNEELRSIAEKNLRLAEKNDPLLPYYKKYLGAALNNAAVDIQNKGNSVLALQYYLQSLSLREEVKDTAGIGETLNNIGLIYHAQGNIPMAVDYYQRSLKFQEQIDDVAGMSTTLLNLGVISSDHGDLIKARDYFEKSLRLQTGTGDEYGRAHSLSNLAKIYQSQGNYDKARTTYLESLSIREKINDRKGIAYSLLNIGTLIALSDSLDHSNPVPEELSKSLAIFEQMEDKEGIAYVTYQISQLYFRNREYVKAKYFALKALKLGRELGYPEQIRNASGVLYHVYKELKEDKEALSMYELYVFMRDSISNEEIRRISLGKQFQYEFDKRTTADSVKAAEQQKVMSAMVSEERTQRMAVTGVLAIMIVFAAFMLNRWRVIRKQKLQIQAKNAELSEEKKKSDDLLLNILPAQTAEELKKTGQAAPRKYAEVSVMFTDFVNFTLAASVMDADALVHEIHHCYSAFDRIISAYPIEKIKTIGDGYMCASGLPVPNAYHAACMVTAALEIQRFMEHYKQERKRLGRNYFEARVGIHSGPVISGVVGTKKFAYDIWGDTVNIAARVEAGGSAGKVAISQHTFEHVKNLFETEYHGKLATADTHDVKVYFVKDPENLKQGEDKTR